MQEKELEYSKKDKELENPEIYEEFIKRMYKKKWVVYCKEPFESAERAIQYLARYTNRIAISNERIKKVEKNKVTFTYKDYRDNQVKESTITIEEFIRRFAMHILPPKFIKIRYYGLFAGKNKKEKIEKSKRLTGTKIIEIVKKLTVKEVLQKMLGDKFNLCPCCQIGHMILMENTT